ncbi:MAG: leucine-rich repeat protein, partial [Prevotella sp.]|nr:leucine-rich repeat protein [Candidatus Equicola stercoris]
SAYSIRNGTRFIGERAFQNCVGLTSVTIPISVISIGDDAFSRCSSLEDVFVSRGRPYTISDNVFDTNDKGGLILITLHVPIGKTMVFQLADVWCKFYNIQEWDPSTGIEEIKSQSTVNGQQSTDLYNLQGVKISGQQNRGIVIKNGKKYVVK